MSNNTFPSTFSIGIANTALLNNKGLLENLKNDLIDLRKEIDEIKFILEFIKEYTEKKKKREDSKWF
jgi:hypothetical protein|tara:strand:- start:371 stop:571 length:201 start_codon:yes stop_codon:yes gene_type:complete